MSHRTRTTITLVMSSALTGLAVAGLAGAGAGASAAQEASQRATEPAAPLAFHFADDILGSTVHAPDDREIAEVDELIADRGTGRILHVVVEHHELLELGDDRFAIPFGAFSFDAEQDRLVLDTTEERLERMPEFRPDRWTRLSDEGWFEQLDAVERQRRDGWDDAAPPDLGDASTDTIEGRIDRIDRTAGRDGETVVIEVSTDTVEDRTIVLGPAWYVMGRASCPTRGADVQVTGFRHDDGRFFARTMTIDDRQVALRDADGTPQWNVERNRDRSAGDGAATAWPALVRVSRLIGQDAGTTDEAEGEVQSVLLEMTTGRIAAIGFDPNENIFGIADTIRAVPWPVIALGPDHVRIDARPEMIRNAMEMPDDPAALSTEATRNGLYAAFDVEPQRFTGRAEQRNRENRAVVAATWGADGPIAAAIRTQSQVELVGTIADRRVFRPLDGGDRFTALEIDSAGTTSTVLLAPDWYIQQSDLPLTAGQNVRIDARRIRLGDTERLVAVSVTSDEGSMTLWKDGRPAWRGSMDR